MIVFTEDKKKIVLASKPFGEGGEGAVYKLDTSSEIEKCDNLAAKIYFPGYGNMAKVSFLRSIFTNNIKGISYPKELLFDNKNQFVGFLMPLFEGRSLYETVFIPKLVKMSGWDRIDLAELAIRILERFKAIHFFGVLMADINPFNILINKETLNPIFIDVDSYQTIKHSCTVCTQEFLSPRLTDVEKGKGICRRELEDEYYAITVLLFKIFLVGKNPYARNGTGSLQANLHSKDFVFPEGYDYTNNIPHGPWQRIWYNLPYMMRSAFYKAFRDAIYLKPEEWIKIIKKYKEGILEGLYPRVIFPEGNNKELKKAILELDSQTVDKDDVSLRTFDNLLIDESQIKIHNYAFVEFGTNSIKCFETRGNTNSGLVIIETRHFECVDENGFMNLQMLENKLEQKILEWQNWLNYISNFKPIITHIHAFGGRLLRNLKNRKEVIALLRNKLKISFGIYHAEEEVEMLLSSCSKYKLKYTSMIVVDVNGAGMVVAYQKGNEDYRWFRPYGEMGSKLLSNWFFATSHEDTRLTTKLRDHDLIVESQTKDIHIKYNNCIMFGSGIIRELYKFKTNEHNIKRFEIYTIQELKDLRDLLTYDLSCNRQYVKDIYYELKFMDKSQVVRKLELRLCLSIYISLMENSRLKKIKIMPMGTAEAHINNFNKNNNNIL